MSRKKFSGKVLAIQLSSNQLRVARMSLNSTVPVIQATSITDLPEGSVVDGVIHQLDTVRTALRNVLETPEFKRCKRVIFSLCTTQVISEETSLPPVPAKKLDKMLESNMDMYFPVDTQNYHLAWEMTQRRNEKGEMALQLWAVSTAIVQPYYLLANSLGLSVLAIDYCGHALATAVGASFAHAEQKQPKKAAIRSRRKGEEPEDAPDAEEDSDALPAAPTDLYLMAEQEHLLMLFVRDGHVELQRMFLCGPHMESELSEVLMAMDYYDSMQMGGYGSIRCTLCGALAEDDSFVALTREVLGIPVTVLPSLYPSDWVLALGAVQTTLDFGVSTLNQPGGTSQIHNAWQYGLILAGGAALALTMVATLGSKTVWTTTLNGLENTKQTLQIQAAQNANYAQNYYNYQNAYQSYSADWDTIHNSLRTYNDNLVLIMDELEDTLPKKTSVTRFQIADNGLVVSLASPSKNDAAYTLIALRDMQYATLGDVSDLYQPSKPEYPYDGSELYDVNALAGSSGLMGFEPAPVVGSGLDYSQLLDILNQAQQNNGGSGTIVGGYDLSSLTPQQIQTIQAAYNNGLISKEMLKDLVGSKNSPNAANKLLSDLLLGGGFSKEEIVSAMYNLTPEQVDALEDAYAPVPELKQDLDALLKKATFKQRQKAARTMLTTDPIGLYRFMTLFKEDMYRPAKDAKLHQSTYDDISDHYAAVFALVSGDLGAAKELLPVIIDASTKDNDALTGAENLMREDPKLKNRYTYYLAVEMGELDKEEVKPPTIDPDDIIGDIVDGKLPEVENPDDLKDALDTIIPGVGDIIDGKDDEDDKDDDSSSSLPDWLDDLLNGGSGDNSGSDGNSGSSGSSGGSSELPDWIFDIIGGGNSGTGGIGGIGGIGGSPIPEEPVDERYHYTVVLGYKDALIQAERERKGLNYDAKVAELEVDA